MTKIRSINQHGEFEEFDQFDDDLPDTAPGIPSGFQVIPGESGIMVNWEQPEIDVLQPVTGYQLQLWREGGEEPHFTKQVKVVYPGEDIPLKVAMEVAEMDPGKHEVRLAAINPVGTGEYATLWTTVTPATPQFMKNPLTRLSNLTNRFKNP